MAVSPSDNAKKLISRPDRNSSITTSAPAEPNAPSNIMATALSASPKVWAPTPLQTPCRGVFGFPQGLGDNHPLARGEAVGLDHDRRALAADISQRRRRA